MYVLLYIMQIYFNLIMFLCINLKLINGTQVEKGIWFWKRGEKKDLFLYLCKDKALCKKKM